MRASQDRDEAFTLIELMVVVLIIAILIAVAIPTFLGARKRGQDRGAQSNLRTALIAEKVHFTDQLAFTEDTSLIKAIEPALEYEVGTPSAVGRVGVRVEDVTAATDQWIVCLSSSSASGEWFGLKEVADGGTAGVYYYRKPQKDPFELGGGKGKKGKENCDLDPGPLNW